MSFATSLQQLLDNPVWDLEEIEQFFLYIDASSINERDCFGHLPLQRVLEDERCSADMVRLLLWFGASANWLNYGYLTPLHVAIQHFRDESIISVFCEAGADVNHCGKNKESALCDALICGASIDVIRLLLTVVASPHKCSLHDSVMHCAMNFPRSELKRDVVKLLIEAGANVNKTGRLGQSPMCIALQRSPVARDIKDLMRAGFSLTVCNRHHKSPFFCVTAIDSHNTLKACVVELLLKEGASITIVQRIGYSPCSETYTPLQRALSYIEAEVGAIQLLFDRQKVGREDVAGPWVTSLLTLAIQNPSQKLSVVKFLIKQGGQVKNVNKLGKTALHLAIESRKANLIEYLLKHCSLDMNSVNGLGQTPLRVAVEGTLDINILHLLLAAGARVGDDIADPLLKVSLSRYRCWRKLDYFKLLASYSLLQNPDFDIHRVIKRDIDYKTLSQFAEGCKLELQKMELRDVGQGRSLREFLSGIFLHPVDADQFDPINYGDLNQLLDAVEEDAFPIYFNVILAKVRRSSMKAMLKENLLYTVQHCSDTTCIPKNIILDCESVCVIAAYLSDAELLRLVFACYNSGENARLRCRRNAYVSKQNLEGKRSPEQSDKFPKRPKLFR